MIEVPLKQPTPGAPSTLNARVEELDSTRPVSPQTESKWLGKRVADCNQPLEPFSW